jgi:hypothetical protein
MIFGIVSLSLTVYFLFGVSGWWRYIPGTAFLAFGVFSVRLAVFGTAQEVRELTGDAAISEQTKADVARHL